MNRNSCMAMTVGFGVFWCTLCGCDSSSDQPELGEVSGTITMNGEPLVGTVVVFSPDNGRPSRGKTDSEGKYDLIYIGETRGAKIGHHRVEIAPNEEGEDESEIESATAGESVVAPTSSPKPRKIIVPARYNVTSELQANVKAGENVFDFRLEAQSLK